MTQKELKELLASMGYVDSLLFESPSFCDAVIGVSNTGQVCYSYERMIDYLIDKENMEYEDAVDVINYDTERSLSYQNPLTCPIIIYELTDA